jgi:hypothetical protein
VDGVSLTKVLKFCNIAAKLFQIDDGILIGNCHLLVEFLKVRLPRIQDKNV